MSASFIRILLEGQTNRKNCSFAGFALNGDMAAVVLNNPLANRKSQADALGLFSRKKRLENFY